PKRYSLVASSAWITPCVVETEESPLPPYALGIPLINLVSLNASTKSSVVVPISVPVYKRPFNDSTYCPNARNHAGDLSFSGSPMMTAFPPPKSRSAAAHLYVIPSDKRSTSSSASFTFLYGYILVLPNAGPSVVSCIAIIACNPVDVSLQNTTCSW